MKRRAIGVAVVVVALGLVVAGVTAGRESRAVEEMTANAAAASGSLHAEIATSRIETATPMTLHARVSRRSQTPVYVASSGISGSFSGRTTAEIAAYRAAHDAQLREDLDAFVRDYKAWLAGD